MTDDALPENVPALIALLQRQRALYEQLRNLSAKQAGLIQESQAEALLGILAERQKLIDGISALNAELEPYRRRWDALCANLAEPDRQRVGELVRHVQEHLGEIIQQDERDRLALQSARSRVGEQIQSVARSGQAVNAYRTARNAQSAPAGPIRLTNQQG